METTGQNLPSGGLFRFAEKRDVPAIVSLLADDTLGRGRENTDPDNLEIYLNAFDDMQAHDGNGYLLAVAENGDLLGCVQITIIAGLSRGAMKRAQFEGIRVASMARDLGIGKLMMAEAHAIAAGQGCELCQLTTDHTRKDALSFYEGLGYRKSHHGMKLDL